MVVLWRKLIVLGEIIKPFWIGNILQSYVIELFCWSEKLTSYFLKICSTLDWMVKLFLKTWESWAWRVVLLWTPQKLHFNNFFSQSLNQPLPQSTSIVAGNHEQFFNTFKSIKSNATGSDNNKPLKFVKLILHHILPQITFLINSVITTLTFPLC